MVVTVRSDLAAKVDSGSAVVEYYDRVLDNHATLASVPSFR